METVECKLALVGYGNWGRNHARVLEQLGVLAVICEADEGRRSRAAEVHPKTCVVATTKEVEDSDVHGVVIAAPAATHAGLAAGFLRRGKHVFVEKPLSLTLSEGREVVDLAKRAGLTLQVGHILEYHPVRGQIRELLASGRLGKLLSARLTRTNLGTIRSAEDVLFSFAPHDIAFALELAGGVPRRVTASGFDLLDRGIADSASVVLEFSGESRLKVQIYVSWLEPIKEHRSILVGSRGMLEWNDTKGHRGLTLYRTEVGGGKDGCAADAEGREEISLAEGEPLKEELMDFISAVTTGSTPRADGRSGLDVLAVLEAAQKSINTNRGVALTEITDDFFLHETAEVHPTATVGRGTRIWHNCHVMKNSIVGENVTLGQNCFVAADVRIGSGTRIQNNVSVYAGVELAKNVFVGPSAVFTNVRYPRAFVSRKTEFEKTVVRRGATVGANATVVCGTTIGEYGFVAAGAVVTKDVAPYTLVEGVPAVPSGFVCRCGERLDFLGQETTRCTRCEMEFSKGEGGVEATAGRG